ncbi:MAG: hypothetical protein L0H31_00480, partial [Nocardioidaceae bacterium]|nr:hypothetical protein [Nocardioidaceae bacterium]
MRTPSLRRLRSALAVPVVLAAVATVATACGEGGGDRDDSSSAETDGTTGGESDTSSEGSAPDGAAAGDGHSRTLSAEEAEQASITVTNLGAGWTERPVDEKEGSTPGCGRVGPAVLNTIAPA